jgi:hypothetical protein
MTFSVIDKGKFKIDPPKEVLSRLEEVYRDSEYIVNEVSYNNSINFLSILNNNPSYIKNLDLSVTSDGFIDFCWQVDKSNAILATVMTDEIVYAALIYEKSYMGSFKFLSVEFKNLLNLINKL